jgi:polysaccharide pyruvyl transferase CsaB
LAAREYVVISGYYGFDNLGDEAILEEIISEVERLVADKSKIIVLSQNPQKTHDVFGITAVDRWKLLDLQPIFARTKLFISGGGGLFQDASSVKSVVYYFALAMLAKLSGAPTVIYAQGVGPLKSPLSVALTKCAMNCANEIAVRDSDSVALLKSWGITKARLTADPVWCLGPSALPAQIESALNNLPAESFLIGLSLRESPFINKESAQAMARSLAESVSPATILIPLELQKTQDAELLEAFSTVWKSKGLKTLDLEFAQLVKPSQWISLLSRLDLVVGMRFHALLMALKSGVAGIGLAYDPKVSYLMKNFEQPCLNLAKGQDQTALAGQLANLTKEALSDLQVLQERAHRVSASQKELACQNFNVIAKILDS